MKTRLAVALLSVGLAAQAYSLDAAATVVNFDELAVVLNGATFFNDSFDRNTTLNGGSGSFVPSGTTFSDGTPANYFVQGSIHETTANDGQAQFNSANGILIAQAPPNIPLIRLVEAGLVTTTDPGGPPLTPATTFSVTGLFDVALPSVLLGTYQFTLGNNTSTPGRQIRLRVREMNAGPVLQLLWVDLATGQSTIINQVALTPAELAAPQLELEFSHGTANSDVVAALYGFGSGNTLRSFNGTLTELGSTDSSTDIFTAAKNFAQPDFEAFDPVPEPSSIAILAFALYALGVLRRYYRTRSGHFASG